MPSTESAKETRPRILAAAHAVVAERGVAGLTIREVARRAGVATGLVNYHFGTRHDLVRAVIDESRARFLGEVEAPPPDAPAPETLRRILELTRALVDFMPGWFHLTWEVDLLAMRDPRFSAAALASKARGTADVELYLSLVARLAGREPPADVTQLAEVILAAFDGVAARQLVDPDYDRLGAYRVLERLILRELLPGAHAPAAAWNLAPLGPPAKPRRAAKKKTTRTGATPRSKRR